MAKRFSIELVESPNVRTGGQHTNAHAQGGRPSADLMLDIRTTYWGIVPTRMRHYAVKYTGQIALTDLRTGKLLANASCTGDPADDPDNPTIDELKKASPGRLKAMVRIASEYCFQDYRKRVLGLDQPASTLPSLEQPVLANTYPGTSLTLGAAKRGAPPGGQGIEEGNSSRR